MDTKPLYTKRVVSCERLQLDVAVRAVYDNAANDYVTFVFDNKVRSFARKPGTLG